jgi:signal transduction histidine kinase
MNPYILRQCGDEAIAMKIKKVGMISIVILIVLTVFGTWAISFLSKNQTKPDLVQVNDLMKTLEEEGEASPKVKELKEKYGLEYSYVDGKLLIYSDQSSKQESRDRMVTVILISAVIIAIFFILYYIHYIQKNIIQPFHKMQNFASEVAAGNFDMPLSMDKNHLFGAFTESFDIMREEMSIARENERKANESKKELVASLSHDIKTPLASIKAMIEVLCVKNPEPALVNKLEMMNGKADQIEALINNLFHATLEEIQELRVQPVVIESIQVAEILRNSDFNHQIQEFPMQECLVEADPLRLQQVFDNLIHNSYKYANTKIKVTTLLEGEYLCIIIKDHGAGVSDEELLLLKQKYYRGKNSVGKSGAGIGLYISDYFMKKMHGFLELENETTGFKAIVGCKLV